MSENGKSIEFGKYMSTYDFVSRNKLGTEATELFGMDWEAEDDVDQIQELIKYIGGKHVYVRSIEPTRRADEDMEVYFDDNMATIDRLKAEIELLKIEAKKYEDGFDEVMCYFDSISDEEQNELHDRLTELGL
jgi:hypothetical protein